MNLMEQNMTCTFFFALNFWLVFVFSDGAYCVRAYAVCAHKIRFVSCVYWLTNACLHIIKSVYILPI